MSIYLPYPVKLKGIHVLQMLDFQAGREQDHSDRAARHDLFKLLKTLAEAKKIFPSQLHLEGVECTEYDRQHAINTIGGFSDVYYGKYQGKPVALKKLRMMGSDRRANDFFLVSVTLFRPISVTHTDSGGKGTIQGGSYLAPIFSQEHTSLSRFGYKHFPKPYLHDISLDGQW